MSSEGLELTLFDASRRGAVDVVKAVLEKGADPNARLTNGLTPLMYAAFHGQAAAAKVLIAAGANLDAQDQGKSTALICAAARGNLEVLATLVQAGANPYLRDAKGASARDVASPSKASRIQELLTEAEQTNQFFSCPKCQKRFRAPPHVSGKRGRCPRCGDVFAIPTAPSA